MWSPYFTADNIIQTILQALFFFVGLCINIKIVLMSLKHKDGIAWQMQVVYSISIMLYSAFQIPFSAISHATEHLGAYTGVWFCHVAEFLRIYFVHIVAMNSLIVAIVKYILIVHPYRALQWGHDKIERLFLVIYLVFPFVVAMYKSLMQHFTNNYWSFSNKRCFGLKDVHSESTWQDRFHYNLKASSNYGSDNTTYDKMLLGFGVFQQIVSIVMLCNITELFLYHLIFNKMKRFVIYNRTNNFS